MDPCIGFWQFHCPYCSRSESAGNSSVIQPVFSLEMFICKAAHLEFIISENSVIFQILSKVWETVEEKKDSL